MNTATNVPLTDGQKIMPKCHHGEGVGVAGTKLVQHSSMLSVLALTVTLLELVCARKREVTIWSVFRFLEIHDGLSVLYHLAKVSVQNRNIFGDIGQFVCRNSRETEITFRKN